MLAFSSYSRGNYTDAINAARRFISLNPNHEDAPYAQYIIGLSYFKQMPDVTRDQAPTRKAADAFRTLLDKYPNSEYASDVQQEVVGRARSACRQTDGGRPILP